APTQVVIIPIAANEEVTATANKLKADLEARGIRVSLDDSKKSPGWKFAEYEMKGVALRIEVGPRDLEQGNVQVVFRHTREKSLLAVEDVLEFVEPAMAKMHEEMYQNAVKHVESRTFTAKSYDEFKSYLKQGGYIKMSVSGQD